MRDDVINLFNFYQIGIILDDDSQKEYNEITDKINYIYIKNGSYNRIMKFGNIELKNALLGLLNNRKQLVNNYFKNKNDLKFVFINLDQPDEYARFLKEEPHFGLHLSGYENKALKINYLTDILPIYFLIDKTGIIISERINEPSTDEGRSLIRTIESLLYKK
jgi:hypothetical protein